MKIKPGQIYKHWKTKKLYTVICLAKSTDINSTELVVYSSGAGNIWARPLSEWFDIVYTNNETKKQRFSAVEA